MGTKTTPSVPALDGSLRERLRMAADVIGQAQAAEPVLCQCEDYCRGRCFAAGCLSCPVSTWSFPGLGADLCVDPGPLGTGLLCRVDSDGKVTENACCGKGTPCALP